MQFNGSSNKTRHVLYCSRIHLGGGGGTQVQLRGVTDILDETGYT